MALSPAGADLLLPQLPGVEEGVEQSADTLVQGEYSPLRSPLSDVSADSGVLAECTDEDEFLASLFGEDFPILSSVDCVNSQLIGEPLGLLDVNQPSPQANTTESAVPRSKTLSGRPVRYSAVKTKVTNVQMDRNQRNAEMARLHRQKKKQYVETLEKSHVSLKTENVILKTRTDELRAHVKKLENEVQYLKSVLANQSTLATLIRNIPHTPGVRLSSSFESRKRPHADTESDSPTKVKRSRKEQVTGGVCLHVSKDVVSLEFCPTCSQQAALGAQA